MFWLHQIRKKPTLFSNSGASNGSAFVKDKREAWSDKKQPRFFEEKITYKAA